MFHISLSFLQSSTFQAVLATDGEKSFALLIYGELNRGQSASDNTAENLLAFLSAGDDDHCTCIPQSTNSLSLMEGSNVVVPGTYLFRVNSLNGE